MDNSDLLALNSLMITWNSRPAITISTLFHKVLFYPTKLQKKVEKAKFTLTFCDEDTNLLSTGKCKISDLLEENILWAVEIQFFTRSSIDLILNFAD